MSTFSEKYFGAIRQLLPKHEAVPTVGIDIGKNSCKLVEVIKKGESYELLSCAVEPIVNGDTAASIKAVLGKLTQPSTAPTTAIFGKGTLIRYIDMPKMSLEDLKKSFAFEADKYFPFQQDQIYTDCFILGPKEGGNRLAVLVVAAKKELIDERVKLLTRLGLQANFVGVNSVAIANVVNELGMNNNGDSKESKKESKDEPAYAILDMGETVSCFTIIVGNLPRFTRDIFIGGRELTRSITNALGISFEEAEKLKCNPGKRLQEVLNACDSAVSNLVSELRLSYDYFVTENNVTPEKLYLTGGATMLEGLPDEFTKNLELKVDRWKPLESLERSADVTEEEVNKYSGHLGVALGLALYQ